MKSLVRKIVAEVAELLPDVEISKRSIVVPPTHHIVRGFYFERTPYGRTFYLWKMFVPLFRPMGSLNLSYSQRISITGGAPLPIEVQQNATEKVAKDIAKTILSNHLSDLRRKTSVKDFLSTFPLGLVPTWPAVVLDQAIAQCIAGNTRSGRNLLESLKSAPDESPSFTAIRQLAARCFDELEQGQDFFMSSIGEYEAGNVIQHFPGIAWKFLREANS